MAHHLTVPRRQILGGIGTAIGMATAGCSRSVPQVGGDRSIEVPERTLIGRPLPVRLSGFSPFATVSVTARTTAWYQGREVSYRGHTQVRAGPFGSATIDLSSIADGGGTNMALWDLKPEADFPEYFVAGGKSSFDIRITVKAGEGWSQPVKTTRVYREPELKIGEPDEAGIHGLLYEPPSSGKTPGVVFLHGSGGHVGEGPNHLFCRLLATQGYTVLALRYFGPGLSNLPDTLARVPLEYFQTAITWLESKKGIEDPVTLVGISRGGEAALLAGATFNHDGAVISYSGSGLIFPTPGSAESPAWTYEGDPMATTKELRRFFQELQERVPTERRTDWPNLIDRIPEDVRAPVVIPVEEIEAPVLLLSGLGDGVWPAPQYHRVAENRLKRAGHSSRHEHLTFRNAGHIFWTPYMSYTEWTGGRFGGEETPTAHAAARSWPKTLAYLSG